MSAPKTGRWDLPAPASGLNTNKVAGVPSWFIYLRVWIYIFILE
jgi:hypothetical protein